MTSPGGNYAQRVALAGRATGGSKPSTATALANSDLTESELNVVGGFVQGMGTTLVARMARASGAQTMFTPEERNQLDALKEDYSDIDASAKKPDPRNWIEKAFDQVGNAVASTGHWLVDNPVSHTVFSGFDKALDLVKLPARMLSSALDTGNDNEINREMQAKGYDPGNLWDYTQFMFNQGNSLFHNLDDVRHAYDPEAVDLAVDYFGDPEAFNKRRLNDTAFDQKAAAIMARPEWNDVADAVDRKHISPGRDVARVLLLGHTNNPAFTAISGALDAAYTLLLDPTLVVGKGIRLARAADAATGALNGVSGISRFGVAQHIAHSIDRLSGGYYRSGIQNIADQDGVKALLRTDAEGKAVTQVGKGIQRFLEEANQLRDLKAANKVDEFAALNAGMQKRFPALMPLLDEVNGRRVVTHVAQKTLADGAELHRKLGEARAELAHHTDAMEAAYPLRGLNDEELAAAHAERESSPEMASLNEAHARHDELTQQVADHEAATKAAWDAAPDRVLTDVNGHQWEAHQGAPIKTVDDFRQYLSDTAGLLRFGNGFAAQTQMIMPGRVGLRMAIAEKLREARGLPVDKVKFDHSKLGKGTIPIKEEQDFFNDLDAVPPGELSDAAKRGDIIRNLLNKGTPDGTRRSVIDRARARHDQRARRLTTLLPEVSALDLTSSAHAEQVRRFARLYLSRGEADRLAALWTMGNAGERRNIARGMLEQTFHASGLSASEQGQAFWARFRADQAELDKQMYGYDGNDVISTERGDVHVALHLSQMSNRVLLPAFREMQYMASKYNAASWFARNVGARFFGDGMDAAMTAIKMGWITSPAGGLRNALDEVVGLGLRGQGKDLLKYRSLYTQATAASREKVLKDSRLYRDMVRQHGEEKTARILGERLQAAGSDPEARKAAMLEARIKHRIPLFARGVADKVNDVVLGQTLGRYLSATGKIDGDELAFLRELNDMQKSGLTNRAISDTFFADDLNGLTDNEGAIAMAKAGLASTRIKYIPKGWEKVEVDGGAGHDAWAGTLAMKFSDPADPAHVALRALWDHDAETAVAEVRKYMNDPRMRRFVDDAEITNFTKDGHRVTTPEEKSQALDEYAQRLVADVKLAVTGRGHQEFDQKVVDETRDWLSRTSGRRATNPNYEYTGHVSDKQIRSYLQTQGVELRDGEFGNGRISGDLAEMLLAGELPDRSWLAALPEEYKPRYALKQQFAPIMPSGVVERMAGNWTEFLSKGYKKVVTDQIQAISRNPLFASKYVTARRATMPYEDHLVKMGWSRDAAQAVTKKIALGHAEQETIKHIDNPQVASQFSVLARNFWAFERAQEDWLRRWGRIVHDDPTVVRKAQLAIHGGESAGILHQDDQGNLTFTYPGSGALISTINKICSAIGLSSQVNIPVVPDLSSKLTFVNPSLDNPLGYSATPVISLPFKFLASTFGADYPILMSSMDKVVNGDQGAGREWYEQMLPTPIMRIINGSIRTDPGSKFGSAWMQAVAQMEAAGQLDDLSGRDPGKLNEFMGNLSAQIKNNMIVSALLGTFAPASPGIPENDVRGKNDADWSWHKQGLESLKAEWQKISSELSYHDAMTWWTRNHPGELVLANASTTKLSDGSQGATAPATLTAASWMEDNRDFLKKYPGIATYFLPQGQAGSKGAEFSDIAYRSQIEQGIREKKSLSEFLTDIIVQRGEKIYYDTKHDYDDQRAMAAATGDAAALRSLDAQWADEKKLIYATNPLLAAKNAAFAENSVRQDANLRDLQNLMNDPRSFKAIGKQALGVQDLMNAYRDYQAGLATIAGKRGDKAKADRAQLRLDYQSTVDKVTSDYPELADLANGVFRIPA